MSLENSLRGLRKNLKHLSGAEQSLVEKAIDTAVCSHSGQTRADGSEYVTHTIETAIILASWNADMETIIAGILHDSLEDTPLTLYGIEKIFGESVASLVEGITKFTKADFEKEPSLERKVETLRKLFEVMRYDIRIAIIKLADRLHNVRTIEALPRDRIPRFAKETIDIYYKIAYHLGMNEVRREFSDTCMPYLMPDNAIKDLLALREASMKKGADMLKEMEENLRDHDTQESIVSMSTHTRSLYSMNREKESTNGIRQGYVIIVIAHDRDACYNLLKLIHSLYRPINAEFYDFIAAPSENAYQTIRTAVIGPDGEIVFLRIRTKKMDEQEHNGIILKCFKKDKEVPGFSWLTRSESFDQSTRESSESFWEALQSDVFQEAMVVIVDGENVHLPQKATVLDALYARYGKHAHWAKSALVNGVNAQLTDTLVADNVVRTSFDANMQISFEWLGAVETRYAKNMITETLKTRDREEKIILGKRLLQEDLDESNEALLSDISKTKLQEATQHFHQEHFEDLLVLVGEGAIQPLHIIRIFFPKKNYRRFFDLDRTFCIRITGIQEKQKDVLSKLYALVHMNDVEISNTHFRYFKRSKTFSVILRGKSESRAQFSAFVTMLRRQNWISEVRTLISFWQCVWLMGSFVSGLAVILASTILLLSHAKWLPAHNPIPDGIFYLAPLVIIVAVNYHFLLLLRRYVIRLRRDKWFIGLGFLMNIVGLVSVIAITTHMNNMNWGILPFIAIFALSLLALGYQFFRAESLFLNPSVKIKPISQDEWKKRKKRKIIGYLIRLGAVTFWGVLPIFLKYTPAGDTAPFVRVFLISVGALFTTLVCVGIKKIFTYRRKLTLNIPRNIILWNIVIGQALFLYFISASLRFTSSTNFILFNNFSPVFALLITAVLWRQTTPYLKNPKHMMWIFLVFLMGSTGGSLIIYNSVRFANTGTVYGDMLGLAAMASDTLLILAQIRYIKNFPTSSGVSINLHVFTPMTLIMLPFMLILYAIGSSSIAALSMYSIFFSLMAGVILGLGILLNYEAFKRIDGVIAFLMFNISILITFCIEVFFLHQFSPTWLLVLGGSIIIASTVLAELINSHCEKKGL